jgi:hypothetical protein
MILQLLGERQRVPREEGVRVVICELPVASPWLNNIEPCWTRARRAVMEVDRKLTAAAITDRVCEHFHCELLPYLKTDAVGEGERNSSISEPPERIRYHIGMTKVPLKNS